MRRLAPRVHRHERPLIETGTRYVVRARREQRDPRASRRQQVDFDVAASLRGERNFGLHVFQKVHPLAVLNGQQQGLVTLRRNGPAQRKVSVIFGKRFGGHHTYVSKCGALISQRCCSGTVFQLRAN